MLVITRRVGESLDLEGCTITLLRINGGQVKLGIDAPAGVRIMRSELLSKQEKENGSNSTAANLGQPDARKPD